MIVFLLVLHILSGNPIINRNTFQAPMLRLLIDSKVIEYDSLMQTIAHIGASTMKLHPSISSVA